MVNRRLAIAFGVVGIAVLAGVLKVASLSRELGWSGLAKWKGVAVADIDFQQFVAERGLTRRGSNDCGSLADRQDSWWMNVRDQQVVRVSVRIRPEGTRAHAFTGSLDYGIRRDDGPASVIKKLGAPAYDVTREGGGGRYLVYGPHHLVLDFSRDERLAAIHLGTVDP